MHDKQHTAAIQNGESDWLSVLANTSFVLRVNGQFARVVKRYGRDACPAVAAWMVIVGVNVKNGIQSAGRVGEEMVVSGAGKDVFLVL